MTNIPSSQILDKPMGTMANHLEQIQVICGIHLKRMGNLQCLGSRIDPVLDLYSKHGFGYIYIYIILYYIILYIYIIYIYICTYNYIYTRLAGGIDNLAMWCFACMMLGNVGSPTTNTPDGLSFPHFRRVI